MKEQQTFTHRIIEADGKQFHLLTANNYPWVNIQVVTFPPEQHDEAIERIHKYEPGWLIEYPGRKDFAIIQAGGVGKPDFHISDYDPHAFVAATHECLEQAAEAWATQQNIINEGMNE